MTNNKPIKLTLSPTEAQHLHDCLLILQDGFAINEAIDESCMAILLGLGKSERKELKGFVGGLVDFLGKTKRKEKLKPE